MKFNWGTGIIIAFALFMSFILYFVFKVQTNSFYDNELVTEEYYKNEATLQQDINKQKNAQALDSKVVIDKNEKGIIVTFPQDFNQNKITGTINFYRPSSKKLDFKLPISLINSSQIIPKENLASGIWEISVDWKYNNISYLNKQTIYF